MSSIAQTLQAHLQSQLDTAQVCPWAHLDPALQFQLSQAIAPESQMAGVVFPESQAELAEVVACAAANQWRLLPFGAGSKLHWGGLAQAVQLGISTAKLNRLIDHAAGDLTVTAEAGMKLSDLQPILAQAGQFLAIDPAYAEQATLGGIISTADTGALRQRYGGLRDLLLGLSIVRSDGKLAKAGGRVVKNVAGYDLMKLFTGAYGSLGIITQVTLRLHPLPETGQTVLLSGTAEAIAQAAAALLASALTPAATVLLAPVTTAAIGGDQAFGLLCRFQSIAVSVAQQVSQLEQMGQAIGLQRQSFSAVADRELWQQLQQQIDARPQTDTATCKIGVPPAQAVATLAQLAQFDRSNSLALGAIYASSGLGWVRASEPAVDRLQQWRQVCQSQGGFLSLLAAPIAFKQAFARSADLWGDSGSALPLMKAIKHQFDPNALLSPHRFVGGI